MDPGPMGPMGGDFGQMTPEPPPGFLPQPPPPSEQQLLSQRASPEFINSQGDIKFNVLTLLSSPIQSLLQIKALSIYLYALPVKAMCFLIQYYIMI